MKMYKRIAIVLGFAFLIGLAGFALADPAAEYPAGTDRFIGFFVTEDPVSVPGAEMALNANGELEFDESTNRIYAVLEKDEHGKTKTVFPNLQGAKMIVRTDSEGTESETDPSVTVQLHITHTDEGTSVEVSGTLYVKARLGDTALHIHNVYQTADGRVYLTAEASGFIITEDNGEGDVFSIQREDSFETRNGFNLQKDTMKASITLHKTFAPESMTLTQMRADHTVVRSDPYDPSALPEEIRPASDAEYLLWEIVYTDKEKKTVRKRELYSRADEFIATTQCDGDTFCESVSIPLHWNQP